MKGPAPLFFCLAIGGLLFSSAGCARVAKKPSATQRHGRAEPEISPSRLDEETAQLQISVNIDASCASIGGHVQVAAGISKSIAIAPGKARVVCIAKGHLDASADVDAVAGQVTAVSLELRPASRPKPGAVRIEPLSGLEFVYIPAGTFALGCEPQDSACDSNEAPSRRETVAAFWLGKTDVTVAAYKRCETDKQCASAEKGGSCNEGTDHADHPINCVDQRSQAPGFCHWAGGRLPTAEEWEYAAKGGESRVYPWGDQPPNQGLAKYASHDGTAPAGAHLAGASRWGLLDMAGDVWQWTSSSYGNSYTELRGGGWADPPRDLRASHRNWQQPSDRHTDIGFRCLLEDLP